MDSVNVRNACVNTGHIQCDQIAVGRKNILWQLGNSLLWILNQEWHTPHFWSKKIINIASFCRPAAVEHNQTDTDGVFM